ncbi:MAG: hypothetical protein V3U80_09325 [Flavobacteriaceae bacterium]
MNTALLNFTNPNNSKNVIQRSLFSIVLVLISILFFTSCESDEQEEQKADGVALQDRFANNRKNAVQTFSIDGSENQKLDGNAGTIIIIPANSIGLNGVPTTGVFEIQLIEIYNKTDMVLQNMSTKGEKPNGDEEPLTSEAEFFINATQNGTQLEVLSPIEIRSVGVPTGQYVAMKVFRAGDSLQDNDLWKEADENGDNVTDDAFPGENNNNPTNMTIYNGFTITGFGWSNLDIWGNSTSQLTTLFVDAPSGYNLTNCAIFISYDGFNAMTIMDRYDNATNLFTEHFGRVPVGQEVHFIMMADIGGQLHYSIQASVITTNHTEIITNLQPISESAFTSLLNTLP